MSTRYCGACEYEDEAITGPHCRDCIGTQHRPNYEEAREGESPSLSLNHDQGKPPIALVPSALITGCAEGQAYGANKYGDPHNWRRGLEWSRTYSSMQRHLLKWVEGQDIDEESGVHHLKLAACRLGYLLTYVEQGLGVDDRHKKEK